MPKIVVVIPMFGKEEYTRRCVELTKKHYGTNEPIEILVVDDGSPTPFEDPSINVLRLEKNLGFTGATNEGILWAQYRNCDYVLLLNNDTEPHENFLKHLLDVMEEDPNIAIAGSVRFHPKDESFEVELYGLDLLRGFQAVTKLEHLKDEVIQCNWEPLCSSLIRMDVIREIGLLDKRMRNHSSDLDYCLRVKMAGYNIVVVTDSRVLHHHEVTTSANKLSPEKDQMVLLEKLAGLQYAQLMKALPLDAESKTYGKLDFTVYKK